MSTRTDVEVIRVRAHELSEHPEAGTADENWLRAERELGVPAATAAERQITRMEEGWSLEEIYAEQVRAAEVVRG